MCWEKTEADLKKAREDLRKASEQTQGQMQELEKRANAAEMEAAQLRDKVARATAPFAADSVTKASEPKKKEEAKVPAEPRKEDKPGPAASESSMPMVAPRASGDSAKQLVDSSGMTEGKGLDIGTVNLVAAENNDKGEVLLRKKRNAFLDVPQDTHTRSMLKRCACRCLRYDRIVINAPTPTDAATVPPVCAWCGDTGWVRND